MELHDFIAATLVQIARGIENAAGQLRDSKAIVNPRAVSGTEQTRETSGKGVERIDFDVAVTAEKGRQTMGGFGIQVGSIGSGSQGTNEASSSSVSRIKFSVPMVLPMENARHEAKDPK